ncbi:MAG: reprolysin-like metallopeptidase [Chitinophagaceae bacterium]
MKKVSLAIFFMIIVLNGFAQSPNWSRANVASVPQAVWKGRAMPQKFEIFKLNQAGMAAQLNQAPSEKSVSAAKSRLTIDLPDADGKLHTFTIVSAPVAAPGLLKKLNGAQSYSGKSVTDPNTVTRFSISKLGLNAIISTPGKPTIYIRSLDSKTGLHIIFTDDETSPDTFNCTTGEGVATLLKNQSRLSAATALKNANTGNIRVFRLALAASGEFGDQYDSDPANSGSDAARISAVLAYQLTWVTDANFYLERDFGVRMQVIADNDKIIYLDGSTDPFVGVDLNAEIQTAIDTKIGTDNYDIGHLMNYTPGGNAGNAGAIGSICNASTKGRGFTGRADWTAFTGYASIMFTHELGHQCGANHTFTHQDDNDNAQVEPGSGSTIMSYGGNGIAVSPFVIGLRDKYFHAISIQQATDYVASVSCGSTVSAGNTAPTVNAGPDYTVPKSTPFTLKGSASDAEGDPMTFTWEQLDKLTADGDFPWTLSSTNTYGPAFRSRAPSTSLDRTLPVNGISDTWEVLSSVPRTFNLRFTARDNALSGAQNNSDDVIITVADAGPLTINSPNGGETICPGNKTITWNVNGTDGAGLAPNVRILLSYDGGSSFPVTLLANTPNDGTQQVTIPCTYNNTARIKVEAVDNIFFDISNANFTVGDNTKPTFTVPADKIIAKNASCGYDASLTITGDVTDENDNCSSGLNATYVDNIVPGTCTGETKITRTWTLTDACLNSTVKVQTITVKDITPPTFTVPADKIIFKDATCGYDASVAITGDVTDENDNCNSGLNATYIDNIGPGACTGETKITRTWTLTDACLNSTVKVQTITVKDITKPTFTVPPAITIYKDANCNHDASVAATGDVTDEKDNCDNNLDATFTDVETLGTCIGNLTITRTWRLVDGCGNATVKVQLITVEDKMGPEITNISASPNSLWPPNHKMKEVVINYDVKDNCSDAEHITTTLSIESNEPVNGTGDGDTEPEDYKVIDNHKVLLRAERAGTGDGRIYTITITSTDDCGNTTVKTTEVYVAHNITGPFAGKAIQLGNTVSLSGVFQDLPGKKHTARWVIDETNTIGGTVTCEPQSRKNGTVTGSYNFKDAGVYKLKMEVIDQAGNVSYASTSGDQEATVVIYDPSSGNAFGGGWFSSPAGAIKAKPTLTGKASFGFEVHYFKKAKLPKGETRFEVKVGDFEFTALNYEYLAISGNRAQMKGSGRISGMQSGVNFVLTVIDNGDADYVRMKIYNKNTGEIYYDNEPGKSEAENPTTVTGVNSEVKIINNQQSKQTEQEVVQTTEQLDFSVTAMPNPSPSAFTVQVNAQQDKGAVHIRVWDNNGRVVEQHTVAARSTLVIGNSWVPGFYILEIQQNSSRKTTKLIRY